MSTAFSYAVTFETETCCNCGAVFAMTADMQRRRREDGQSFFCPNGHSQRYTETEIAKLKKQVEQEQKRRQWAEQAMDDARKGKEAAVRAKVAMKGVVTKIKKRVAHGVCPCCKRSFQNLQRHMAGKHPDFAASEETT